MSIMSRSLHTWYSLHDLDILMRRRAVLEGQIELQRLHRLTTLLCSTVGRVNARLAFRVSLSEAVIVDIECSACLELECQRCLESMTLVVECRREFGLVENDAAEAGVPEGVELISLNGDRFNPAELIEDELIISLPLVARHEKLKECGQLAQKLDKLGADAGEGPAVARVSN